MFWTYGGNFKTLNYPKSDTFNIGSEKATKIRTLASLIIKSRKGKKLKLKTLSLMLYLVV